MRHLWWWSFVPPAPVLELVAPAPVISYAALAPVVEYVAPAPAVAHAAIAPLVEFVPVETYDADLVVDHAPAPAGTYTAQDMIAFFSARPAVPYTAPAPVETSAASSSVYEFRHAVQRAIGAPVPLLDASASSSAPSSLVTKKGEEGQAQEVTRMLPHRPPSCSGRSTCPPERGDPGLLGHRPRCVVVGSFEGVPQPVAHEPNCSVIDCDGYIERKLSSNGSTHHRMLVARLFSRACWCPDGCVASRDALFFFCFFLCSRLVH